jgi:hypothetical protein
MENKAVKNFTNEIIQKAKVARNAEELLTIAKESNVDLTEEEAKKYFEQLNLGKELSDDELDMVAGGNGDNDCNEDETFVTGEVVSLKIKCYDCKYHTGLYIKPDNNDGCFVECANCHKAIWFKNTRESIEKVDLPRFL